MNLQINDTELDVLTAKLQQIINEPKVLALVGAEAVLPTVHERIHIMGQRADGGEIGTYSNEYLRVRQRYYNRTGDSKIIFSLTRQMENDFTVAEDGDRLGLGFNNAFNFNKATWLEESHPGVYDLSVAELDILETAIDGYLNDFFAGDSTVR